MANGISALSSVMKPNKHTCCLGQQIGSLAYSSQYPRINDAYSTTFAIELKSSFLSEDLIWPHCHVQVRILLDKKLSVSLKHLKFYMFIHLYLIQFLYFRLRHKTFRLVAVALTLLSKSNRGCSISLTVNIRASYITVFLAADWFKWDG